MYLAGMWRIAADFRALSPPIRLQALSLQLSLHVSEHAAAQQRRYSHATVAGTHQVEPQALITANPFRKFGLASSPVTHPSQTARELARGVLSGKRLALSRAITLCESSHSSIHGHVHHATLQQFLGHLRSGEFAPKGVPPSALVHCNWRRLERCHFGSAVLLWYLAACLTRLEGTRAMVASVPHAWLQHGALVWATSR